MNRRNFLYGSAVGTSTLMLSNLKAFNSPLNALNTYQLKMFATNWGFEGNIEAFCDKAKKSKYDGIEVWWPTEKQQREELFSALKKHSLEVGFLVKGNGDSCTEQLSDFKTNVNNAATNSYQLPNYINCHSGKDYFSFQQNKEFINFTINLTKKTGVKIYHETHRARILFAAHIAKVYFEKIPDLRITLDASHWCNVAESLLTDQQEAINLAIQRTDHIHARVGHEEGPQVSDPRAPEWEYAVKEHFKWWDAVVSLKKQKGEVLTVLTEFGSATYMPTLPFTRQPVANQWDINLHMMKLFKERYS